MNLFGLDDVSEAERKEIARRSLNNLLTSYADEADVFTEIIQNAFDALIGANQAGLYGPGDRPNISVVIGRRSEGHHYIFVSDNGLGMARKVAENITVPGYSFGKKKGKTLGYKGVGASYFFAASQKVALKTIDRHNETTEYTVRGSYEWVKHDEEQEPIVDPKCDIPESIKHLLPSTRGTGIYFQFHEGIKPKNLSGIVVTGSGKDAELRNWMCYLAAKTALGSVRNDPAMNVGLTVYLDSGDGQLESQSWTLGEFDRDNLIIGYPFPHRVLRNAKNIDEIDATPDGQKPKFNRRFHGVHKRWTAEQIIENTSTLETNERQRLLDHLDWCDGYLCYSTDVMKTINERLGGRSYVVKYGIKIAVDGVPQGRNLDISLTSSQGLDRQTHIVLSFRGLELDTGRKISADETIVSAIGKVAQRIVAVLKDYRWALKKKDRPEITSDLENWRASLDQRAQLSIVRELFKKSGLQPVFRVDPENESEVIALFVALLGNGLIKGYQLQAISGFARYDSLADIDRASEHVRDLDDSLSIRSDELEKLQGKARVLEFKYSFNDLLEDFDDRTKNPSEIDFVVCWTLPDINLSRGRLEPTYGKWRDSRSIYAGTYVWLDENETSRIPVIALRNVTAELLARAEKILNEEGLGTGTFAALQAGDTDSLV